MINESMPNWTNADKADILHILKATRDNIDDIPSPREIKHYINQVGILRKFADQDISTKCISYYVIHRFINNPNYNSDNIRKELLKRIEIRNFPKYTHLHFLPSTCLKEFAGLIFCVNTNIGQQLLLEPEIQSALQFCDYERLMGLKEDFSEGFWYVYDFHVDKIVSGLEFRDLLSYSFTIYNSIYKSEREKCQPYINKLITYIETSKEILWPDSETIDKFRCVISLLKDNKYIQEILHDKIFNTYEMSIKEKSIFKEEDIKIYNELKGCFSKSVTNTDTYVMKDFAKMKSWANIAINADIPVWKWVKPSGSVATDIAKEILPGTTISDGVIELIDYAKKAGVSISWAQLTSACDRHIAHGQGVNNNNHSAYVFQILTLIAFNDQSSIADIITIINRGYLFNLLEYFKSEQKILTYTALLFAICIKDQIQTYRVNQVGYSIRILESLQQYWSKNNNTEANTILHLLKQYNQHDLLWILIKDRRNILAGDILDLAVKDPKYQSFFKIQNALERFELYCSLGKGYELNIALLEKLMRYSNIENETFDNNLDYIKYSFELSLIVKKTNKLELVDALSEKLSHIEKSIWLEALINDTYLIKFMQAIKDKKKDFFLSQEYCNALIEFSRKIKDNLNIIEISKLDEAKLEKLYVVLVGTYKKYFKNKITAEIIDNKLDINIEYFKLFEPYITNSDILSDKKFASIIDDFLEKEDYKHLDVVYSILSKDKSNTFKLEKVMLNAIKDKIHKLFNNASVDHKEILTKLAKIFKLDL
jgi:hypothetical protein